jgi:transcription initiation factor TFIID subunit TAF12
VQTILVLVGDAVADCQEVLLRLFRKWNIRYQQGYSGDEIKLSYFAEERLTFP